MAGSTQEEGGQEPHGGQDWLVAPGAWLQRAPGAWDMRERLLMAGCAILAASRAAVLERTGFTCSAGVADNKLMAKLCSGMHKPNQQTVLTRSAVPRLMAGLPVDRIRGLGGKLGARVLEAGISTVGDLAAAGSPRLRCLFGDKTGQWLHRMAHGLDDEPVKDRRSAVSVSGEKRYDSGQTITSLAAGQCAIRDLAGEISERLAVERVARRREPHTLTLGISAEGESNSTGYASRSCACRPGLENLVADAYGLLRAWAIARGSAAGPLRIHGLALSATGFKPLPGDGCQSLSRFLYPETPQSGRSMDLQDASDSSLPSRGTGLGAGSLLAGLPPSPQIVVREPPRHQGLKRGCPWSPTALPQKQSMAPGMDSGPSGILECEDTAIITPGPPGSRLKDESTFGPDAALRPDGNNGPPTSDTGGGSSYPLAPLARAADEVKNCHGNLILSLRREDLDESVLRELPVDIRMEVLAATDAVGRRPAARNEATKRKRKSLGSHASTAGRSIKSFFTPSKGRNGA